MKRIILFALIGAGAAAAAQAGAPRWLAADRAFHTFTDSFEQGIENFLNGDPHLWKHNVSQTDRATIMGAWGAYEQSWAQAGPRYDWAAARFEKSGAKVDIEYLSGAVSGDLAYTVAIERSSVRIVGQSEPATMQLRVTHVFGRENGVWKLLHRHADPLMAKTAPADVLAPAAAK